MTRRRKERAVSNSMPCTDGEWARIRAAAEVAGEGILGWVRVKPDPALP